MTDEQWCPRCGRSQIVMARTSQWDGQTTICDNCVFEESVALHWGSHDSLHPVTGIREWVSPPDA